MSSAGEALLAAVIDRPEDDVSRLAYADWLEEHGADADRAEAIRLGVQRRKLDDLDPKAWALDARLRQICDRLWDQDMDYWRADLPKLSGVSWCVPLWGFTSRIAVRSPEALRQHEDAIFAAAPVTDLDLMLENAPGEGHPAAATLLAGSRRLHRVQSLELGGMVRPDVVGLPVLGDWPAVAAIRELNLGECAHDDDLLESLAESKPWPALRSLNLYRNLFRAPGLRALAGAPMMSTLTRLEMARGLFRDEGARELLRSPYLKQLRHLNLSENQLNSPVIGSLVAVPFERLEVLDLSSNDLGAAAIQHLAESPHMRNLRRLDLSAGHNLSDSDMKTLAQSPHLNNLEVLGLGFWKLRKRGLETLASAPWLSNLTKVDLMSLGNGDEAMRILVRAPLHRLRWLELGYSKLGAGAVSTLLSAPWVSGLTHLDLSNNNIGTEGARALAEADQLDNLVSLDVTRNKLSEEAGNLLRQRFGERVKVKASWER
jgi:uncharacterized protein (TIGR02996 family)